VGRFAKGRAGAKRLAGPPQLDRDCRLAGEAGAWHDVIIAVDALAWG